MVRLNQQVSGSVSGTVVPHPHHQPPVRENCYYCIEYSTADAHAAKFPRHNVNSIQSLAQNLTSPFPNSPVQKARAIFTWFHHNIAYDTVAYFGGNVRHKSPEETLRSGLAVCQGYAELFEKIARAAGLEVMLISGYGKGYGYRSIQQSGGPIPPFSSNHAWNAVKLNGQWQPVDPCWGAGSLDDNRQFAKRFESMFFTSSPEEFRLRHFPSNAQHQFCSKIISWGDYMSMIEGPLAYMGFTEKGFNEASLEPKLRKIQIQNGQSIRFVIRSSCPHMPIKPHQRVVLGLTVGQAHTPLHMEQEGRMWTAVVDSGFLKRGQSVQLNYINRLGDRTGNGLTLQEFQNMKSRVGYSWTGLALWDVC